MVLLIFKDILSHFAKFQYDLKAFTAFLPTLQQAWRTLVLLVTHRSFPLGEEEGAGNVGQMGSTWAGHLKMEVCYIFHKFTLFFS